MSRSSPFNLHQRAASAKGGIEYFEWACMYTFASLWLLILGDVGTEVWRDARGVRERGYLGVYRRGFYV